MGGDERGVVGLGSPAAVGVREPGGGHHHGAARLPRRLPPAPAPPPRPQRTRLPRSGTGTGEGEGAQVFAKGEEEHVRIVAAEASAERHYSLHVDLIRGRGIPHNPYALLALQAPIHLVSGRLLGDWGAGG